VDIRQFLTTRRARITPEQAELPHYGDKRRVPGLRREEVALLAGISIEYYARLERGDALGVSPEVLDGIARALRLDDVERAHLEDLVRVANSGHAARSSRRRSSWAHVRPSVQRLLDAMTGAPPSCAMADSTSFRPTGSAMHPSHRCPIREALIGNGPPARGGSPRSRSR
jgi:transcriptional regulator with XRE-family HTH domain